MENQIVHTTGKRGPYCVPATRRFRDALSRRQTQQLNLSSILLRLSCSTQKGYRPQKMLVFNEIVVELKAVSARFIDQPDRLGMSMIASNDLLAPITEPLFIPLDRLEKPL